MTSIQIYPDLNQMAAAAAGLFIDLASNSIKQTGQFTVVLSGGTTPDSVFEHLTAEGSAEIVDWNRIHFFWGDERVVPPDDPQSNYRRANLKLLQPLMIQPQNIHRIKGELDPIKAATIYQNEILKWLPDLPPRFDLILLGMGEDGHTASLFPGTNIITAPEAYEWVASDQVPQINSWRVTFTPRLINAAKMIIILVAGNNKADTLQQVLEGPFQPRKYPSQLIKPDQGKLIWMVDHAAGQKLNQD